MCCLQSNYAVFGIMQGSRYLSSDTTWLLMCSAAVLSWDSAALLSVVCSNKALAAPCSNS